MASRLDELVTQLARNWSIEHPRASTENRVIFEIDDKLSIIVSQSGDRILLEGVLGPISVDASEDDAMLSGLLLDQHLMLGQEETLCLEPDTDNIVLYRRLSASTLTLAGFEQALESLANRLETGIEAHSAHKEPRIGAPSLHYLMP